MDNGLNYYKSFLASELASWPMAAENFTRINDSVPSGNRLTISSPDSPWRIDKMAVNHRRASITARTDTASIAARPCFLCEANRPACQSAIRWGNDYEILVNPYPLATQHFTIASVRHENQCIAPGLDRILDMAGIARELTGMCVFYNGARCGASAPDHFHFQAVSADAVPNMTSDCIKGDEIIRTEQAVLYSSDNAVIPYPFFIIESANDAGLQSLFSRLWLALASVSGDSSTRPADSASTYTEPPVNIAMMHDAERGITRTLVIPRSRHRPQCYSSDMGRMLISPATIEMLGTIVCSRREDFDRLDLATALSILKEVSLSIDEANLIISRLRNIRAGSTINHA